jgi:nitronate monooxygenase
VIPLRPLILSGREVCPLIEGGKGISISNGLSSGAWAAAGGIGTFSGVNGDYIDELGKLVPLVYRGKTRLERHEELISYAIKAAISQARIAHDVRGGEGRLHMNVLWEMASCERVLNGVLEGARGLIHGITCGAGMPYRLAEIAARYNVYYYPIVSSARAFRALWKRAYHHVSEWLGGVVYEDPWRAGGHNGLSNSEDPRKPEAPFPRVRELRGTMRDFGLDQTAIIMAGGVWHLRDWRDWLDNDALGPIGFQFGTRPLLTRESPISDEWKRRLLELNDGDVMLHRFSPTGFYSSAVYNDFLQELDGRSKRQVPFATELDPERGLTEPLPFGTRGRSVFVAPSDVGRIAQWVEQGFSQAMKTPDDTLIYVAPEKAIEIRRDQVNCMGCLSACKFSNWSCNEEHTTGRPPDPRSFCIQKTLQDIAHNSDVDHQLMFAGHNAFKFRDDPFYSNGFIPTVRQLVSRIATGD